MTHSEAHAALLGAQAQLQAIQGFIVEQGSPDEEDLTLAIEAIATAAAAVDVLASMQEVPGDHQ